MDKNPTKKSMIRQTKEQNNKLKCKALLINKLQESIKHPNKILPIKPLPK